MISKSCIGFAGEEDQDSYDIHRLRKPDAESIHKPPLDTMPRRDRPLRSEYIYNCVGHFYNV